MSQENVEVVRRCLVALNRQDYGVALACLGAGAEWHNTAAFPGRRRIVGAHAIVGFWRDLLESFEEGEGGGTVIEDVAAGDDRVVVAVHTRGQGAASGVPIDVRYALTLSVDEGRINRVDVSGDYTSALRAAGIEG